LFWPYRSLGFVFLRRGAIAEAIPPLEYAVKLCRVAQIRALFAIAAAHLGYAYALSGRLPEGVTVIEEAVADPEATGTACHPLLLAYLGEAHLLAGRRDEAAAVTRRALDLAHRQQERGNEAWVLRLLGDTAGHANHPDLESAEGHYTQALARANELEMRPLAAHCHLGLGKLFHRTGDRARAAEHLRPQPGCTARWTWASGWRGRRRNSGRPYELTLNRDSRPRSQPRRPKLGSRSYERNSRYERERVQDAFPSLPASRCKTTWLCTTGNSLAGALRSGAGEGRSADRLATTPGQAAGDSRLCHAEPPRGLMGAYAASSGGRTFRGRLSTYRGRAEGRTSPDGPPYPPDSRESVV